jgi:hypothetical protein
VNTSDGGSAIEQLPEGLYELLKTDGLMAKLSNASQLDPHFEAVDDR